MNVNLRLCVRKTPLVYAVPQLTILHTHTEKSSRGGGGSSEGNILL